MSNILENMTDEFGFEEIINESLKDKAVNAKKWVSEQVKKFLAFIESKLLEARKKLASAKNKETVQKGIDLLSKARKDLVFNAKQAANAKEGGDFQKAYQEAAAKAKDEIKTAWGMIIKGSAPAEKAAGYDWLNEEEDQTAGSEDKKQNIFKRAYEAAKNFLIRIGNAIKAKFTKEKDPNKKSLYKKVLDKIKSLGSKLKGAKTPEEVQAVAAEAKQTASHANGEHAINASGYDWLNEE